MWKHFVVATSLFVTCQGFSASPTTIASTTANEPQSTQAEFQLIRARRINTLLASVGSPAQIPKWLSSLGPDGKWPDSEVDYTTGCQSKRASWPAQAHWKRILIMAGAWRGGIKNNGYDEKNLTSAISRAMDYWFARDFTNISCLDSGGTEACPCDNVNNSLWNVNWFSNIILIPDFVGRVCLLMNETLSNTQWNNCTRIATRSYSTFVRPINRVGNLTGANALDVASIGIDLALLTNDTPILTDAYRRVHLELEVKNDTKADGIRADGSFAQHAGMLYNGNYGKDYASDVLDLELVAAGTRFSACLPSRSALATLFEGNKWMIVRNAVTGVLHWDLSAIGRFISAPTIEAQATGSIHINLTRVLELGQLWSSDQLISFASELNKTTVNANAGKLGGNKMFYTNDYMVHRGKNYVTTLKMFSSRTQNAECTNSQNPKGFHLSDGVLYTYVEGNEYEDIAAAWDWNFIPGITVDYNATELVCNVTRKTGLENFVGGVSDGQIGAAAMRYTNPITKSLHWQKAWFFLNDDVQQIMVSALSSTTNSSVLSVLDQKRFTGTVVNVDAGRNNLREIDAQLLWHGNVGYLLPPANGPFNLSVKVEEKSGSWSAIGTSTQPPTTAKLFTAWISHTSLQPSLSYIIFPGVSHDQFLKKSLRLRPQILQNDEHISGVYDAAHDVAIFIFWDPAGGTAVINREAPSAPVTITVNANVAVIYKIASGDVIVSDPSQTLSTAQVMLALGAGTAPPRWGSERKQTIMFHLPDGGLAGSSVIRTLN